MHKVSFIQTIFLHLTIRYSADAASPDKSSALAVTQLSAATWASAMREQGCAVAGQAMRAQLAIR
jgi:hypothetical protein